MLRYMPDFVQKLEPSNFVEAIALAFGVTREDYQLGLHKIFLRAGKAAFLEELKEADIDTMVPILVEKIKFFEKKKQAKVVLERRPASSTLPPPPTLHHHHPLTPPHPHTHSAPRPPPSQHSIA